MSVKIIPGTESAYSYPLLIKQLLHTPLAIAPEQEITYQGRIRYTYRELRERIGRLASGLAGLGVEAGDTVAVMDWDSHRYLECFFAVPMMGAILQTVNVRLNAEQILYTLNHAGADVLLVNREFFPLLAPIAARLETVRKFVLIDDDAGPLEGPARFAAEYEALLEAADPGHVFEDFVDRFPLVGRMDVRERLPEGFLFLRMGRVRRPVGQFPLGVDVEEFERDLFRVHFGPFDGLLPFRPAELLELGLVFPEVFSDAENFREGEAFGVRLCPAR